MFPHITKATECEKQENIHNQVGAKLGETH